MNKMHENELSINEALVRSLLNSQCPDWADLPLNKLPSSGTDHALFRLGSHYVVRLPRIDWAVDGIDKECKWLPKLAQFLKIPISNPLFKGHAESFYPWSWLVTQWQEGHNPAFEQENEYAELAKDAAHFLNELHGIKLANSPLSRRGVPLKNLDQETRKAINELKGEIDIAWVTHLWEKLIAFPTWQHKPVWVHGDFLPGNIVVQDNRLSAVIDFSDVGIGDPACDLVIAWSLFNPSSREIFKQHLENIDEHTWERGRGWALSIALIMLPYYQYSNLVLTKLARRMIKNIISE